MMIKLRKICIVFGLIYLGAPLYAKEDKIETIKEKVPLKVAIPGLKETFTAETTYKFSYPKNLNYFNVDEFGKYATGFLNIDGSLSASSRSILGSRIKDESPANFRFEIETTGIEYFRPYGMASTSYEYSNGFVQDYAYTFPCKLKIYKGNDLAFEYILDDGKSIYTKTFYKDYRLEAIATQSLPKLGFASIEELESSFKTNNNWGMKFKYCVEYQQYLINYEKAKAIILALYGTYNFKENVQILSVEIEKGQTDIYPELNNASKEFMNILLLVKSYDDLVANSAKLKSLAEIFQNYSKKENINKSLQILCLRNASFAEILISDIDNVFQNMKTLNPIDKGMGIRLDQTIPPFIEAFGVRATLDNYKSGEIILSFSDIKQNDDDKKIIAFFAEADSLQKLKEAKELAKAINNRAVSDALDAKNIRLQRAEVIYTDGTQGNDYISIYFYKLDEDSLVSSKCGKEIFNKDAEGNLQTHTIKDIDRINLLDQANQTIKVLEPIQIVRTLEETTAKAFSINYTGYSEKTIAEFVKSVGSYNIYIDKTDIEENTYIVMATKNNAKKKGYRVKYVIANNKFGDWMKVEPKIVQAIKNGEIKNTLEGAVILANLLQEYNLPSAEL